MTRDSRYRFVLVVGPDAVEVIRVPHSRHHRFWLWLHSRPGLLATAAFLTAVGIVGLAMLLKGLLT